MTRVAVLGASGFVGSQVAAALEGRGVDVVRVAAPRLGTASRTADGLAREAAALAKDAVGSLLVEQTEGCVAVVNAAGVAVATGRGDDLFGANALLPALLAAALPASLRLVHVSSAVVQGRRPVLDESDETEPFSPYSASKALGEHLALAHRGSVVCFRPTSVQGAGRPLTETLRRICGSPLASVARPGTDPTPQALVANVADAAAFLALADAPPRIVLHPWEGLTTADLVLLLGARRPLRVPRALARALVSTGMLLGRRSGRISGQVRRLEMLWFGQAQSASWLEGRWTPPAGRERWKELG